MLRYLTNHQINYAQWDACVANSEARLVYGFTWYLDVVAPGWAGLVKEEAGQYVAVMPLPVNYQWGLRYIRQPFFCQQLGVFGIGPAAWVAAFLPALQKQFPLISKYSFNTNNFSAFGPGLPPHLKISQHYTHHLNLNQSYPVIRQHYTRDRKINLQRSQQAGLIMRASTDIEPLIQLFKADAANRIYGGVSEKAYGQLRQLYQALASRGYAALHYTYTSTGELDAGCLFVIYGHQIIYLFNAASVAGRRRNGRSLMIDQLIQQYAGQPYVFDFESPAAVPAISRVYQGFGAVPVPYLTLSQNNLPAPLKFLKSARQFIYQKVMATFAARPSP